jgi:ribosomal protein S18 acetylase RimI-like enzyme
MYRLAVADEHRRRGIASALVRDAERRLLARGARRVSALVGRGDETATAFWRAAGYQPDDGIRRYVRNLIEPR